jgi:hypothetical protein
MCILDTSSTHKISLSCSLFGNVVLVRILMRLFTRNHLLLRESSSGSSRFLLGFTSHGRQMLGDVKKIETVRLQGTFPAFSPLAKLAWEGYNVTSHDELYHAIWCAAQFTCPLLFVSVPYYVGRLCCPVGKI